MGNPKGKDRPPIGRLCLDRRKGERIHIGDGVVLTVIEVQGKKVKLGIEAARDIPIHRAEVQELIRNGTFQGYALSRYKRADKNATGDTTEPGGQQQNQAGH